MSEEALRERYNGCKPCLHGSDAHDQDTVGKPFGDRFSWIKGGLEFDALRQACIDPAGRAFVGTQPPFRATPARVIARPEGQAAHHERIKRAGAGFRWLTEAIDITTAAGRLMMQLVGSRPVGWSGARMPEPDRGRPLRRPPAVTRLIRHGIYHDVMSTWEWLYFVGPLRLPAQAQRAWGGGDAGALRGWR